MDLHDIEHNTKDGVHIASLAGAWMALVCGFGGMRHEEGAMSFMPRLPGGLARIAFHLRAQSRHLHVEVTRMNAKYVLVDGDPLTITHHGEELTVSTDKPQERPIPMAVPRPRPSQPPGRAPEHRRPMSESA
jgi:alpha,alpha-trehalose phosphorylase